MRFFLSLLYILATIGAAFLIVLAMAVSDVMSGKQAHQTSDRCSVHVLKGVR